MYKLADFKRKTAPIFDSVDCLAVPTLPRLYTLADLEAEPILYNSNLGTYTNFVNLLDLAAISVPVGMRADGHPSSLTLIGKAQSDGALAGIAAAIAAYGLGRMPQPLHFVTHNDDVAAHHAFGLGAITAEDRLDDKSMFGM